jgi:hypothetical protein
MVKHARRVCPTLIVSDACSLSAIAVVLLFSSGCIFGDRAADRSLTVHQYQSIGGDSGPFLIDVSQLPPDVIQERADGHDQWGNPTTSLQIRRDYPVKIMLVPATGPGNR